MGGEIAHLLALLFLALVVADHLYVSDEFVIGTNEGFTNLGF